MNMDLFNACCLPGICWAHIPSITMTLLYPGHPAQLSSSLSFLNCSDHLDGVEICKNGNWLLPKCQHLGRSADGRGLLHFQDTAQSCWWGRVSFLQFAPTLRSVISAGDLYIAQPIYRERREGSQRDRAFIFMNLMAAKLPWHQG